MRRFSTGVAARGARVKAMVDVKTRLERSGVPCGEPSLALARAIHRAKGLESVGLAGYEGLMHGWNRDKRDAACREALTELMKTRDLIERDGVPVSIVSAGTTSTYTTAGTFPGVTEIQAGTYVVMDDEYPSFFPELEVALWPADHGDQLAQPRNCDGGRECQEVDHGRRHAGTPGPAGVDPEGTQQGTCGS